VYRFATYWPTLPSQYELYWRAPGRIPLTRLLRRIIRPAAMALAPRNRNQAPLQFKHIICVSEAVKKELLAIGVDASLARVIYTGLDAQQYLNDTEGKGPPAEELILCLLYAGRLQPEKGVHSLIQAMDELVHRRGLAGKVSLSVAGSGDPDYESELHTMTAAMGLSDHVTFLGWVPRPDMLLLYQAFDVLVLPSLWPEPFARVVLEGMASGLAIVASREGGTSEVVIDGDNGLMFAAGDVHDLADKIVMLYRDPAMRADVGAAARRTIVQKFTEQATLDAMENYLLEVIENR
jgi:glycosyltransferase involved in cell wall biosynthesis